MLTSKIGPLVGKTLAVTGGAIAIHTNLQVLVEMVGCIYFHRKFEGDSTRRGLKYYEMDSPVNVPSQVWPVADVPVYSNALIDRSNVLILKLFVPDTRIHKTRR